jgi:hypothetical protein
LLRVAGNTNDQVAPPFTGKYSAPRLFMRSALIRAAHNQLAIIVPFALNQSFIIKREQRGVELSLSFILSSKGQERFDPIPELHVPFSIVLVRFDEKAVQKLCGVHSLPCWLVRMSIAIGADASPTNTGSMLGD